MINNNHIQIVMNIIKAINTNKKSKGKKYLSDSELNAKENFLINIANKYNRVVNWFVNNPLKLKLMNIFSFYFSSHKEYLYLDELEMYVSEFTLEHSTKNKFIRFLKNLVRIEVTEGNIIATQSFSHAKDISSLGFWEKRNLISNVNKTYRLSDPSRVGKFRIKRFCIIEKKENDG